MIYESCLTMIIIKFIGRWLRLTNTSILLTFDVGNDLCQAPYDLRYYIRWF